LRIVRKCIKEINATFNKSQITLCQLIWIFKYIFCNDVDIATANGFEKFVFLGGFGCFFSQYQGHLHILGQFISKSQSVTETVILIDALKVTVWNLLLSNATPFNIRHCWCMLVEDILKGYQSMIKFYLNRNHTNMYMTSHQLVF